MSPQVQKRIFTWGVVAGSLTAIGGAIIMGLQLVKPAWAYVTLPARTAALVTEQTKVLTDQGNSIADIQLWRRRKERRDWKTRWYLEQLAHKNGIPIAPEPRERDLDDE